LLLTVPALVRTGQLYAHLRSDLEQLLPPSAPSVLAIRELRARMPGLQSLGVLVDFGPPPSGTSAAETTAHVQRRKEAESLLDDLATRVGRYPRAEVAAVRRDIAKERRFVEAHLPLLIAVTDLREIRARLEERLRYEFSRATDSLLSDDGPPPLDFSDIEHKYEGAAPSGLVGDRLTSDSLGLSLLLIETSVFSTSAGEAASLLAKVKEDVAATVAAHPGATGFRIGYTGDVAVSAEETSALEADLTVSTLLVIVAVIGVIILYYRWGRAVPAIVLPVLLAAAGAFALASLPPFDVRELNSNTAFLGSIILGNGINFGIVQLARYVEARRRGDTIEEALAVSLWGTRVGTLSAALAAAVSYASLVGLDFRGFRQFGIIGGLGMVLAWVATFVLGPPLTAWLDGGRLQPEPQEAIKHHRLMGGVARFVSAYPRAICLVAVVVTALAAAELGRFGHAQLEYDLSRLRRHDTWTSGEGFWGGRMDRLLGRYLTPVVLLTDDPADADKLAAALREEMARPPLADLIASVRTVSDVLPADQAERAVEVERIRKKITPNVRSKLSPDDLARVDRLLGAAPAFGAADVPDVLLTGLRERDGSLGKAVLVFPRPSSTLWQGPAIRDFVASLRRIADLPRTWGHASARVAGGPPLTADILASMAHDGPRASLAAFVGVMISVFLLFRLGMATPFVLGSLIVGVSWQAALAMFFGIRINFINFVAFPITFGIGVDYAVNVMGRYLRDGQRDVLGAIRGTGGAVGLCSVTTVIGYSSLLVAKNRGLFSFGLLAVLGELTCLVTAVVVLPAVLSWRSERHKNAVAEAPETSAS
jgi:predicted RND superfamily exporter protein